MEKHIYLSAAALPTTGQKELIDRQKAVLLHFGLASSLALPPVYPLRFSSSPFPAEKVVALRDIFGGPFTFAGYRIQGPCIFAAVEGTSGTGMGYTADKKAKDFPFPVFPGFYLAYRGSDRPEDPDLSLLQPLPLPPVRVVRHLEIHILVKDGYKDWWRGVEWEVLSERYVKLDPSKPRRGTRIIR